MKFFIDVKDDPPAITGLKEWCANQIGEGIAEAVNSSNCRIQIEDNALVVSFTTQVDFEDNDGMTDCIYKNFDLSEAIREHLDVCGNFDALKASVQNLLTIFDEYKAGE